MKDYKGNKFGKRGSARSEDRRDGGQRFGKKDFERRDRPKSSAGSSFELHHAVCDKCGRDCDVPFKPTGNKPIYCRSCFREGAGSEGGKSFDRAPNRFEQEASNDDLERINKKLDKIMKALKID